jgi:predicted DNA-binding ribbon-helix-helix protein
MADTFKKIVSVEMDEEDKSLYDLLRQKSKFWDKLKKMKRENDLKRCKIIYNINGNGNLDLCNVDIFF